MAAVTILWLLAQTGLTSSDPIDLAFRAVTALGFGGAAIYYVRKFQKDYIETGSQRQLELIAEVARKDAELVTLRQRLQAAEDRCDELEEEVRHGQRVIETLRDLHAASDLLTDLIDPETPDPPEDPES